MGRPALQLQTPFSAASAARFMKDVGVTNLAASPSFYRALRAEAEACPELLAQPPPIRVASSAGEPLPRAVQEWFLHAFRGASLHSHFGQTENGMLTVSSRTAAGAARPPGFMGGAMRGFDLCVLAEDGSPAPDGSDGELAVRVAHSPLFWFSGYHGSQGQGVVDAQGFYRTGDRAVASRDAASGLRAFCYTGRNDDVIKSSGYKVGPGEVEDSIAQLGWVLESAVVGVPDLLRGEAIAAFVVPTPDVAKRAKADAAQAQRLSQELQGHVKSKLAKHLVPKHVDFLDALPKTTSGKVQRFLLKQMHAAKAGRKGCKSHG
jgi:acetyl-CoA synthetase